MPTTHALTAPPFPFGFASPAAHATVLDVRIPIPQGASPMPKPKSKAFARIRAEAVRLVGLIPDGKFTTYGSIATHMNVAAPHVAFVIRALSAEESAALPWHRVVGADGRISQTMPPGLARKQRARLQAEGMKVNVKGFIQDADVHYHFPGPRRSIRWSHERPGTPEKSDP